VYALFTKSDLVAGFTEFFDDLDRERRAQVWGATFPFTRKTGDAQAAGPVAGFAAEFRALVARLNERLFDRLQAERSPEKRALIAGFPAQVASLEQPLGEFLSSAFGGSRLDPAPFLRGVYMASGTQEGTPIDRLTGVLAQAFGVDQRRAPSLRPEQGRSYFLGRLLRDVIFNEAMLVSERPGRARRRLLIRGGAFAAIALVTAGLAALLFASESSNRAEIDKTDAALAAYEKLGGGLPLDPVDDADMPRVDPLLNAARALPYGYDSTAPGGLRFGLGQQAKLGVAARTVYRHAVERVLLPRMVWRLESQMRGNITQPTFMYEATRVYLMLGSAGPLDADLVREWMNLDWAAQYPGATNAPLRADLSRHLDALLANPLPPIELDGALVEQARATFSRVTLAERVYSRIRPSAAARRVPAWTPGDALGSSGARVFFRSSGKPLTDGIPGFFTVDGFHRVLLPNLPATVTEVANESWVLGQKSNIDPASPAAQSLERDVVALYVADYATQWDAMLGDLNVVPLKSMQQAVQDLYVLASPQSPMRDLLVSIVRQLTLSVPPEGAPDAAKPSDAGKPDATAARLQGLFAADAAAAPEPPGKAIDDKYKALRDFVGKGPGAPLDNVLKLLNDLQGQLSKLAGAGGGQSAATVASGEDPGALIKAEADRQPQPVARWLQSLAFTGSALRGSGAKSAMKDAFTGSGGPASLCSKAVEGRYPFRSGAKDEIPLDDFGKLFAAGGMLDAFFNQQIRPFVDMSGRNWKLQPVDGVQPPLSAADLAQFQRAAVIRDLFFSAGAQPTVRFDITPISADATSKQVTLDFNGVTVEYTHGPPHATQITWPGPQGMSKVRLTFDPPPSSGPPVIEASGPWALFRVFNQGKLAQSGSAEQYQLSFQLGDRQAAFQIRAGSVNNPFTPGVLQDFSCPKIQ
jgi:type VI secretion system protein ImpL